MTDMKKSVIELMEEFIHEATPESILNDCRNLQAKKLENT